MPCCTHSQHEKRLSRLQIPKFTWSSRDKPGHSCCPQTDVLFLALFLLFILGEVAVLLCGFYFGDVHRILGNYDCYGNVCGRSKNRRILPDHPLSGISTVGKPFVFQTRTDYWKWSTPLCVKSCPSENLFSMDAIQKHSIAEQNPLCSYSVPVEDYMKQNVSHMWTKAFLPQPCPLLPVLKQTPLSGYCVLTDTQLRGGFSDKQMRWLRQNQIAGLDRLRPVWEGALRDLLKTRWFIVGVAISVLVLSLFLVLIICLCPAAVHFLILVLSLVAAASFIGLIWFMYIQEEYTNDKHVDTRGLLYLEVLNERGLLTIAVATSVLAICLLLAVASTFCAFRAMKPLLKLGVHTLQQMKTLFILPVISLVCLSVVTYFWLMSLGYIATIATVRKSTWTECVEFVSHWSIKGLSVYHVLAMLWFADLIIAWQQFIISAVVMEWYFQRGEMKWSICIESWWSIRILCNHIGTLALSTMPMWIPRILKFITFLCRVCYWWCCWCCCSSCRGSSNYNVDNNINHHHHQTTDNVITTLDAPTHTTQHKKCCGCSFWHAIIATGRTPFVISASENRGFCLSASTAYRVMQGHVSERLLSLDALLNFMFLLAKISVSCIGLSLLLISVRVHESQRVECLLLPMLVVAMLGFFIPHCIFTVFETTLGTLLMCRCMESHVDCAETDSVDTAFIIRQRIQETARGDWPFMKRMNRSISKASQRLKPQRPGEPAAGATENGAYKNVILELKDLVEYQEDEEDIGVLPVAASSPLRADNVPMASFLPNRQTSSLSRSSWKGV